jgi:hypothetical protein
MEELFAANPANLKFPKRGGRYFRFARDTPAIVKKGDWGSNFVQSGC